MEPGKKVLVYYNLHRNTFSIKERYGSGKVIAHKDEVRLRDVTFRVWEGGRQRTLRDRQKTVHAFVEGELLPDGAPEADRAHRPFTYNPFLGCHFYYKDTDTPAFGTPVAKLSVVGGRPVCLAG